MANIVSISSRVTTSITAGWQMLTTAAGAVDSPAQLVSSIDWLTAQVPGTVAQTLQAAGQWTLDAPRPLHQDDYWYRTTFAANGKRMLRFNGLATFAEVWLNGELILSSDNMFLMHEVAVELRGHNELHLCFRALQARLGQRSGKRARWRPVMINPPTLRFVRTTLLGHMPSWCPPVHAIGPWRSIECIEPAAEFEIEHADVRATLDAEGRGNLCVQLTINGAAKSLKLALECNGQSIEMRATDDGKLYGKLQLDTINAWWPHTHGEPQLYSVRARNDALTIDLGRVGFRRIELDRGSDGRGFALKINGVRVFCRGACWSSADIVSLPESREAYAPWLTKMRDAHMNMVRIGGTMIYEANAFYQLCDELGILVWQDFMFANFDYPVADQNFEHSVRKEAAQFLDRTQASPCIAVLCGGSEVAQQAAMLGLPRETWTGPLFNAWLPEASTAIRPDALYVSNSPSEGDLPFLVNSGPSHYYGVSAYLRPLDDARRAEVRFATECLAFSNVPEARTLAHALPVPPSHHPDWKRRVPRDQGTSWDFEDVREHYLARLYNLDPALLRREDVARYLDLSRAVTAEVMQTVFAEWRRKRSTCAGGLVWMFQDLWPGAGWGVVDALGEPKAAWYALRRAFRPLQVSFTDEGVNGLAIHVANDTGQSRAVRLNMKCMRHSESVISAERTLELEAHACYEFSATELLGSFFDTTYAYRFGPPGHTVSVVTLIDSNSGEQLADCFHFPTPELSGRDIRPRPLEMQTRVEQLGAEWQLSIRSAELALFVHIEDEHFRAEDNWFHLIPNQERRIKLLRRNDAATATPNGEVRAVNSLQTYRYRNTQ